MYVWPFGRPVGSPAPSVAAVAMKQPSSSKKEVAYSYGDEKKGLPRPVAAPSPSSFSSRRGPRRSRSLLALILIGMFMVWICYPGLSRLTYRTNLRNYQESHQLDGVAAHHENHDIQTPVKADAPIALATAPAAAALVPLEAHIMSKCPDAQDCLVDLIVPAMQRTSDMVNWTLSFIGQVDREETVHCMHGEEECLGNVMMLCADKLYPDPKISLGFSTCLIKRYQDIPSRNLVESCALEHAVDFDLLNKCVSEEGEGLDLLKASVTRSKDLGVKYSCTVRLNDKVRCIRDGGEWVNCDDGSEPGDLIRDITALYKKGH